MTDRDVREFRTSDGYPLQYRHYPAQSSQPKGYIVALHGIQSHAGWYEYSSGRLADAGYDVLFVDRRGSGLNELDRGHAVHADRLVNDVAQVLADVRFRRTVDAPVIMTAVSWGGKLASVVSSRRPELVDALVLLTPGICARIRPSWHQRWRLNLAGMLGIERKLVAIPLDDAALFTGVAEWQEYVRDDPLSLRQATVSFLQSSVNLDDEVKTVPETIGCPTLMLLAGRDQIVDNQRLRVWFDRLRSPDKEIIEYPEARHTLEFEPNREQIVDDLIGWLEASVAK